MTPTLPPPRYCEQECNNWFSCTYPAARFTTSFFACRILGDERHHILNHDYVVRPLTRNTVVWSPKPTPQEPYAQPSPYP